MTPDLTPAEREVLATDEMFVPPKHRDERFPEDDAYSEGMEAGYLIARDRIRVLEETLQDALLGMESSAPEDYVERVRDVLFGASVSDV